MTITTIIVILSPTVHTWRPTLKESVPQALDVLGPGLHHHGEHLLQLLLLRGVDRCGGVKTFSEGIGSRSRQVLICWF